MWGNVIKFNTIFSLIYYFSHDDNLGLFRGWVPLMLEAPSHALYFSTTGHTTHIYFIVWGFVNNDREKERERERERQGEREREGQGDRDRERENDAEGEDGIEREREREEGR